MARNVRKPDRLEAKAEGEIAPKLDDKIARFMGKRRRKLEDRLAEAARMERKRTRQLERARARRELIESALRELDDVLPSDPAGQ
jgi:hypothetical protein